jgi:tRNA threonylcarbamoyladenosine biosynthesis protein TsaB
MTQLNLNNNAVHFPGRLLALDTSTSMMSIAVLEAGKLLRETHIHAERNHSLFLMPMIQELVKNMGMKLADISGIAVGVGPGSYTGVRIGVTAAKTLAWTLKLPLIGVSSLEAMALGAVISGDSKKDEAVVLDDIKGLDQAQTQWIVPLMDARRAQVYTGLYVNHGDDWHCLKKDGIRLFQRWLEQLAHRELEMQETGRENPAGEILSAVSRVTFVGELTSFLEPLQQYSLSSSCDVHTKEIEIAAYHIGLLGSLRLAMGERANVHQIIPNYTQLTEAETNLLAKSQRKDVE